MWLPKGKLVGEGRKYSLLYDKITPELLEAAFEKVKQNKGCGGVDNETIELLEIHKDKVFERISQEIRTGAYQPKPVKRVFIPKPNGKLRPLGIPTVRDRVVQEALNMLLMPIFEDTFQACSYGFRPNRNAHQAIAQIQQNLKDGYVYVVDADIEKFFDSIDQELMMEFILEEIADRKLTALLKAFLKADVMDKVLYRNLMGTPQGGVISPLFANIYLNKFDMEMQRKGYRLIRYADDWVAMCRTKEEAERALKDAEEILGRLKLRLNKGKTGIRDGKDGFAFLGFEINTWGAKPSAANVSKFKDKIRMATRRSLTRPVTEIIPKANQIISGWGHYFKIGKVTHLFRWLDSFIRDRMRIYIFKRRRAADYYKLSNEEINRMGLKELASILSGATLQESRMP